MAAIIQAAASYTTSGDTIRQAAEGEFEGGIVAQAGSVVGVLITGGDHQHPEAQNIGHAVDDTLWRARIREVARFLATAFRFR